MDYRFVEEIALSRSFLNFFFLLLYVFAATTDIYLLSGILINRSYCVYGFSHRVITLLIFFYFMIFLLF